MRRNVKKPFWKRALGFTLYLVVLVLALGIGSMAGWVGTSQVGVAMMQQIIRPQDPKDVFKDPYGQPKDNLTILVLGCDEDLSRGGKKVLKSNARSDMMLVAKLDFKNKTIGGVSIPRDTLCRVPGYRQQRINAYHSIGGNDLAKKAVEELIGVEVDRVVQINYDAFQDMVNMLGGVDIYVPRNMKYTDRAGGLFINLKKGRQQLDGYNAMCFVRYRHGDSDFKRQERQKDFLLAFKDTLVRHWTMLPKVADKSVELSGNEFSANELVTLAKFAKSIDAENIRMGMVPVIEASNYDLEVDKTKLDETLREFNLLPHAGTSLSYKQ